MSSSLVALVALLVPGAADAYYLETRGDTSQPVRYLDAEAATADRVDVTYRINTASLPAVDGITDAIRASFAAWSVVDCASLAFVEGADSSSTDITHWRSDNGAIYVLIYFDDSLEEWFGGPAVGHYRFGFDLSGRLIGASIVLNSRDHVWATDGSPGALDVQSVVTALIGRSLGITSAIEESATYPSYSPGNIDKRVLGSDDRAAIQYLYPSALETCTAPAAPDAVCDGYPAETPCPPRPETMPGEGGTRDPEVDAGVPVTPPGEPIVPRSGGCTAAGGGSSGAWMVSLAIALFFVARRRR